MGRKSHYDQHRLAVLGHIESAALRHGRPPSVRELAEATGVGVATMHLYLNRLAEEGLVEWRQSSHRSLRCTREGSQLLSSQVP